MQAEKSKQEVRDSAIADAAKCVNFFKITFSCIYYCTLNFPHLLVRSARRIGGIRRSYNLEVRLIKTVRLVRSTVCRPSDPTDRVCVYVCEL